MAVFKARSLWARSRAPCSSSGVNSQTPFKEETIKQYEFKQKCLGGKTNIKVKKEEEVKVAKVKADQDKKEADAKIGKPIPKKMGEGDLKETKQVKPVYDLAKLNMEYP